MKPIVLGTSEIVVSRRYYIGHVWKIYYFSTILQKLMFEKGWNIFVVETPIYDPNVYSVVECQTHLTLLIKTLVRELGTWNDFIFLEMLHLGTSNLKTWNLYSNTPF